MLAPVCGTGVSAQVAPDSTLTFEPVTVDVEKLLSAAPWEELKGSEKPGYLLSLNAEGNFDEDALSDMARKYRHLLGRWALDTATNRITLSVDGFMGEGLVHNRYRKGRDYFLVYEIVDVSQQELIIKDTQTGKTRSFIASEVATLEDQATKRLPQGKKPPIFSLPDFNGGL